MFLLEGEVPANVPVYTISNNQLQAIHTLRAITISISLASTVIVLTHHGIVAWYRPHLVDRVSLRLIVMSCIFNTLLCPFNLVMQRVSDDSNLCLASAYLYIAFDTLVSMCLALIGFNLVMICVIQITRPQRLEKYYYIFVFVCAIIVTVVPAGVHAHTEPWKGSKCWYYNFVTGRHERLFQWIWYYCFLLLAMTIAIVSAILATFKFCRKKNAFAGTLDMVSRMESHDTNRRRNSEAHLQKLNRSNANIFRTIIIRCLIYSLVPVISKVWGVAIELAAGTSKHVPFACYVLDCIFTNLQGLMLSCLYFTDPSTLAVMRQLWMYLKRKYVKDYHNVKVAKNINPELWGLSRPRGDNGGGGGLPEKPPTNITWLQVRNGVVVGRARMSQSSVHSESIHDSSDNTKNPPVHPFLLSRLKSAFDLETPLPHFQPLFITPSESLNTTAISNDELPRLAAETKPHPTWCSSFSAIIPCIRPKKKGDFVESFQSIPMCRVKWNPSTTHEQPGSNHAIKVDRMPSVNSPNSTNSALDESTSHIIEMYRHPTCAKIIHWILVEVFRVPFDHNQEFAIIKEEKRYVFEGSDTSLSSSAIVPSPLPPRTSFDRPPPQPSGQTPQDLEKVPRSPMIKSSVLQGQEPHPNSGVFAPSTDSSGPSKDSSNETGILFTVTDDKGNDLQKEMLPIHPFDWEQQKPIRPPLLTFGQSRSLTTDHPSRSKTKQQSSSNDDDTGKRHSLFNVLSQQRRSSLSKRSKPSPALTPDHATEFSMDDLSITSSIGSIISEGTQIVAPDLLSVMSSTMTSRVKESVSLSPQKYASLLRARPKRRPKSPKHSVAHRHHPIGHRISRAPSLLAEDMGLLKNSSSLCSCTMDFEFVQQVQKVNSGFENVVTRVIHIADWEQQNRPRVATKEECWGIDHLLRKEIDSEYI